MDLPVTPPLLPMLARLQRDLPTEEGFIYEPKWDGFRCLVFRDGDEIDMRSRNQRPLARYFPELVEAFRSVGSDRYVLDGEIVVGGESGPDFGALLLRLHPAASRVERLRRETPASFIAFDLLAREGADLRQEPFVKRRTLLEDLLDDARPPLFLTPLTEDADRARGWLDRHPGEGIDGVVAKHRALLYEPGKRVMTKVKNERTADCVVGGFRWHYREPVIGSLLLGLYDDAGGLRHVGLSSAFSHERRVALLEEITSLITPLEGHPWQHGFRADAGAVGRLPGAASRWAYGDELNWVPLRPEKVCEVAYDHLVGDRFRHPPRFVRWRPDRDPRSCTYEQFETLPARPLPDLLAVLS